MAVTTTKTNKPINPRGNDQSPKGYNRAALYSGKALDFDGVNDDVLSTITISGAKTYCAWINADGTDNERIISISEGGYSNITFVNNKFGMYDGTNIPETTTTFETGQWYFVVGVQEANNAKIYVNGISQPLSTTNWIERTHTGATIAIGRDAAGGAYYDGKISGVRIFNTALTAAQVSDLYNNPEKIVPTGVSNDALKLWLPMMEGAGTTAYDGSGNGNHGTISGATYVNGVGAPVAQSAVMDWNKGQNFFNDSSWLIGSATTNGTISSSSHSAPNGVDTAFIYNEGTGTTFNRGYKASNAGMAVGEITASTFVKKKDVDYINVVLGTEGGTYKFFALVDLVNGTIVATDASPTATSIQSVGDGWYYVSVQATQSSSSQGLVYIYGQDPTNSTSVDIDYTGTSKETYIWGINIQEGAINNVHLPTIGTLQSSDVLLPQGLTSGRDITGVNLFENVRKQGALNLDGNSWAEVHDNASLDFGTGEFTLEAWAKVKYVNQGSSFNVIITLGGNLSSINTSGMLINSSTEPLFMYSTNASAESSVSEGTWIHMVGVYDETNATLYVNGVQEDQDARTAVDTTNALVKMIGRDSTTARYYNDQIAQPRIYNRALTAEEVERNYNAGKNIYK